ncbi:zinc finger, CCHC-type containing protein [Tanacetum coccineum]
MTTSVVNNSVFRGFFEKQRLSGPNFIVWYRQLMIVLSVEDKLNYLEQPIPPAHVPSEDGQQVAPEALAAHAAWLKGSKEIVGLMLMTMEPEIQRNLENHRAYKMLQELKPLFGYIDNLERLGHPVSLNLRVSLILISLRKENEGFVQNYNMHGMRKTVTELHAMLKLYEQNLPKKNLALNAIRAGKVQKKNKQKPQAGARGHNQSKGKSKLAYAPKPKILPPSKKENPAKDSICHECGETGHWKRNCPQYLSELLKKKNIASRASGSVSGNNIVYFVAIPKDGIFEIDLSDSYTNVSSMYDVRNKRAKLDLDSALLWHCRLGHISKKRIEKLQHDGLLNSTDLRGFEKCAPCMSGKMARKPYTHQVERAKDLLGLIHTDSFWDYALKTTARILNMVLTNNVEKTPYKVWHGQAPKLSYLKVWGCEELVKRDTLTKPD